MFIAAIEQTFSHKKTLKAWCFLYFSYLYNILTSKFVFFYGIILLDI